MINFCCVLHPVVRIRNFTGFWSGVVISGGDGGAFLGPSCGRCGVALYAADEVESGGWSSWGLLLQRVERGQLLL